MTDTSVGLPTPVLPFNFPSRGDFSWTFQLETGDFPAGAELYFLIGDPGTEYPFTINGGVATIRIESTVVATIDPGTPVWVILREDTTPTTEHELGLGNIRKVAPSGV